MLFFGGFGGLVTSTPAFSRYDRLTDVACIFPINPNDATIRIKVQYQMPVYHFK